MYVERMQEANTMATKRAFSQAIYDKENTRQLRLKLNLKTDADKIGRHTSELQSR